MHDRKRQRGNVLFLILIAVALFAALSYAVTSSSRGGGGDAKKESATLGASRILNFSNALASAVQRLQTIKGVPVTSLRFDNTASKYIDGTNAFTPPGLPSDPSLYVFLPKGGGVSPQTFEKYAAPCPTCASYYFKPGHFILVWINITDLGTSTSDPALIVTGLDKATCTEINKSVGVASIPVVTVSWVLLPYTSSPQAATAMTLPAGLASQQSFCVQDNTTQLQYHYIRALGVN